MSIKRFKDTFQRMYRNSVYRIWLWVLGFFTVLVTFLFVVGALIGGTFGIGSIIAVVIYGPFTDFFLSFYRRVLKW